jgi:hypothetical protein
MAFDHLLDCLVAQTMAAIEMFVVVEVIFLPIEKSLLQLRTRLLSASQSLIERGRHYRLIHY